MIRRLDHIGIAVKDLETVLGMYSKGLGLSPSHQETVQDQQVKTAFLPVGETHLELLQSLSPDGPIARFVDRRGEGVHHLCFLVDDIEQTLAECRDAGMTLIDEQPRVGANNRLVAFVHPRDTHGVLIEFSQIQEESNRGA